MRIQTIDRIALDGESREKTNEGFLIANAVVTQSKVSNYKRGELGLDGDPDDVIAVYRTPETVFHADTVKTLQLRPVTKGHPDNGVDPGNARLVQVGSTGENSSTDEDKLLIPIGIYDEDSINMVEGGKDQVSLGYAWDLNEESGEAPDGTSYDYISDGPMEINHLALVNRGRLGPGVRVMDSDPDPEPAQTEPVETSDGPTQTEPVEISDEELEVAVTTRDAYVSAEVFLNLFDSFYIDGENMAGDLIGRITEMLQNALSSDGTVTDGAMDKAKSIAKDISAELSEAVKDQAIRRAELLTTAYGLMSEDKYNEVKGKDEKAILIAAVGDTVQDAENRSIDYLRAALDFLPQHQSDDAGGGTNPASHTSNGIIDVSGRTRAQNQRRSTTGDASVVVGADTLDKAYDNYDEHLQNAYRNNGGSD